MSQVQAATKSEVIYRDCDGVPMANNTIQYGWIVMIQQNLNWLFADNPNVFVAGDLFWYPVEGRNTIAVAPDVLVAIGRPKGDRLFYKQWEEDNIPPQVIFEVLSPSSTRQEMDEKLLFFDRYGVEEYYIYDSDANQLWGWLRGEEGLAAIDSMQNWVSPQLSIRFDPAGDFLQLYRPDEQPFLSYAEIAQQSLQLQQQLKQTEQQLEQERLRSQALEEHLRSLELDQGQA
ncbi:MAG TPA: Uma2 family endonuclease [Thermosynechococcaceae cyanobacterium]